MPSRNIKKIVVTSKRKFPEWVRKVNESGEPWAFISIEGTQDLVDAKLITDNNHYLPAGENVLNLDFDDVERHEEVKRNGRVYKIFPPTEDDAKRIIEFAKNHQEYNLLIHCYAGRSRSVAVGQGLIDVFPGTWTIGEDSNSFLTPNMEVLRLLHKIGLYT